MSNLSENFKNILVTGGAGFIGGAVIRQLLINSCANIFNIDKLGYASDLSGINETLSKLKLSNQKRYSQLHFNLSNFSEIEELINKIKPDLILHLAAETHVDRSIENPREFIDSNIVGTFNLLEATRNFLKNSSVDKKNIFKFIHVSTDEVFGSLGENGMFSEKSNYDPRSPYSSTKAASDHLVSSWFHTYNFPAIITNCSNNYGPWQFPEKLIPLVINKVLNKEPIPMYGDGKNIRDWLYVEDHAEAIILVANKGLVGERFCIGGNTEKTNKELIISICEFMDKILNREISSTELISSVPDRPGHDFRYAMDTRLINQKLGWKPSHNFNEGLEKTILWYLNNKVWTKNVLQKSNYNSERIGLIKEK